MIALPKKDKEDFREWTGEKNRQSWHSFHDFLQDKKGYVTLTEMKDGMQDIEDELPNYKVVETGEINDLDKVKALGKPGQKDIYLVDRTGKYMGKLELEKEL